MAEMTIRLQSDPVTGKKNITILLRSDDDALPHEHEQQHAALVEKLIQGGVLKAERAGPDRRRARGGAGASVGWAATGDW